MKFLFFLCIFGASIFPPAYADNTASETKSGTDTSMPTLKVAERAVASLIKVPSFEIVPEKLDENGYPMLADVLVQQKEAVAIIKACVQPEFTQNTLVRLMFFARMYERVADRLEQNRIHSDELPSKYWDLSPELTTKALVGSVGTTPEGIKDPAARKEYKEWLEHNDRHRQFRMWEWCLRNMLDALAMDFACGADEYHSLPDGGRQAQDGSA